jgi:hypothetical protein
MNYGVLTKLHIPSSSVVEVIEQTKLAVKLSKKPNQIETAFYLSANNPQMLYILSLWYAYPELDNATFLSDFQPRSVQEAIEQGQLVEQQIFQLCWEFRLLSSPIVASHLRLMTYPENYSEERYNNSLNIMRHGKEIISGLVGSWVGKCLTSPRRISLHRADWSSLQAQRDFFYSDAVAKAAINRRRDEGVVVEYASHNLQGLIQSEPHLVL